MNFRFENCLFQTITILVLLVIAKSGFTQPGPKPNGVEEQKKSYLKSVDARKDGESDFQDASSEDPEHKTKETLDRLSNTLQICKDRLIREGPTDRTRQLQRDILNDLNSLITQAERPPQQINAGSSGVQKSDLPQEGNPQESSKNTKSGESAQNGPEKTGASKVGPSPEQRLADLKPGQVQQTKTGNNKSGPEKGQMVGRKKSGLSSQASIGGSTGSDSQEKTSDNKPGQGSQKGTSASKSGQGNQQVASGSKPGQGKKTGAAYNKPNQENQTGTGHTHVAQGQAGKEGQPKGKAGKSGNTTDKEDSKMADLYKDVWGHLPETARLEMDQYSREQFIPNYADMLKQYYSTIAEKGQRKD